MILKKLWQILGTLFIIAILALSAAWFAAAPKPPALGIWQSQGYGYIFSINRFVIDAYEVTDVSCMRTLRIPSNSWLLEKAEGVSFTVEDGLLEARAGSLEPIFADKLPNLPSMCQTPKPNTPRHNFDVFWHSFNEHYAFFDLHGVDWQARYDEAQAQLTDDMTDDDLFAVMENSLRGLDDGHIYLTMDSENYVGPSTGVAWREQMGLFQDTALSYVQGESSQVDNTPTRYGKLNASTGYIHLSGMSTDVGFGQREADVMRKAMQQIANDLEGTNTVVVDMRFNPGGTDLVSLAIAELFTSDSQVIFSKTTKEEVGFSKPFIVSLEPVEPAIFQQKVYLLTSEVTGSAAEIFTLAMGELPQVTVIGTNTGGGLSDALERKLPNGWLFSLSNQQYLSVDGLLPEGVGISPDVERRFDTENFLKGKDTLIEEVMALTSAD